MAILVISVDLKCCRCKEKLSKILIRLEGKYCIEKIEHEEKDDRVIVRGQFCAEKLRKEIWCKAGKFVLDVLIVEVWPPKKNPVGPPPTKTPPPTPKPECKLVPYPYPLPYYPLMPWGCPLHCHCCPKPTPPPPPPTAEVEKPCACGCGGCSGHRRHCVCCGGGSKPAICPPSPEWGRCAPQAAACPPPWGGCKVTVCEAEENACSVM